MKLDNYDENEPNYFISNFPEKTKYYKFKKY